MGEARIRVGLLVWEGVELLDFAGPGEVFAVAGDPFEVVTVASHSGPVLSQGFLQVHAQFGFDDCPALDVLVVPGGGIEQACADDALIAYIKRQAQSARIVLSVCTGALVLAEAGLLDGLEVTTWHDAVDRLRQRVPGARVLAGRRWVDAGRIVTTAGVTAGIDGALHVVARLAGAERAAQVARHIEHAAPGPTA